MATNNDENVFASPWNDSDMVLVVEDQELHVHKWILKSQSPVFKVMFNGHFQEASEDKISLKEKDLQSMVQFIKELYPSSMFEETRAPLCDASRLSILALAEEYQCVNLIKQCINQAKITRENVLRILPYAVKYHQTALPRMYDVINWSTPTKKLEKVLSDIEVKETSNTMLLTKCRFLESAVVKMRDAIVGLISDFLKQKKIADDAKTSLSSTQESLNSARRRINDLQGVKNAGQSGSPFGYSTSYRSASNPWETTAGDSRCSHSVGVEDINKIKSCLSCKEKYKEKFLVPIPSCNNAQNFFNMLESGDDVATAVKEQK